MYITTPHCALRRSKGRDRQRGDGAANLLLRWSADESERDRDDHTATEVVGVDVVAENNLPCGRHRSRARVAEKRVRGQGSVDADCCSCASLTTAQRERSGEGVGVGRWRRKCSR